ncbi:MAG: PKD domain-containing protein [Bacteroidia bacterium]
MKQLILSTIILLLFINCCFAQQYTWLQKASFPGTIRGAAVGFAIGDTGYVGTGFNTATTFFNDFFKWDKTTNTWSPIASLPASARYAAVAFSIGNYGYVGTGWSSTLSQLADFWRYDPTTNSWTAIATFPGNPRYTSSVCVVNGKAYFGLGYQPLFNDVWEYDPVANSWTQKANFPGGPRQSAVAFALGNYAYFLTGNNGSNKSDMYRFDPATNTWIQKSNFPGAARYGAVAMEINGKAVVGTGGDGSSFFTDFYEYDAATDTWCQLPNLPAPGRRHVAQFSIGNKSYLATGVTSASGIGVDDLWELTDVVATFIPNITPCNLSVSFTSQTTTATGYSWSFGDGNTSSLANPNHTYSALGTYNVQLIVYYNCGTDTVNQQITLTGATATAAFNYLQTPCSYNISFTNLSVNANSFQWDFGDTNTDTVATPNHTYTTAGNYVVTLIVSSACDTDTVQQNITVTPVAPPATAAYNFNVTPCTYTVNFINTSASATSYIWQYGDGNSSTTLATSHYYTYSAAGNYNVNLIAINNCDTDTLQLQVVIPVINVPVPSFTPQQTSCNTDVQFNNTTVNGVTYSWLFGDGNTSTLSNPLNTYPAAGNYTVTLTAYGTCDTVSIQQQINVLSSAIAIAGFNYATNICDSSITLTNISQGATNYIWSFGDGTTSTLMQPIHQYNAPGNYTVFLLAINPCDTDITQQNIFISTYIPAIAAFNFVVPPCSTQVTFNNQSSNALHYSWNFGDGTFDTNSNPVHQYGVAGNYTVTLVVSDTCKSDSVTMQVNLTAAATPVAAFNTNPQPCDSIALSFNNNSANALSYSWDFGDGSTSSISTPYHIYSSPGVYTVTLVAANNCDTDTFIQNVTVDSLQFPKADFQFQVTPCTGKTTFTNNSTNASAYLWNFGDGTSSTDSIPVHTYTTTGAYNVTLIANPGDPCSDSLTLTVTITDAAAIDWFIPNCFTPNDDGLNDVFEIKGLSDCVDYHLKIFNRWGRKIFESSNDIKNWDGTFEKTNVPEGVYMYIFNVKEKEFAGAVTLLR